MVTALTHRAFVPIHQWQIVLTMWLPDAALVVGTNKRLTKNLKRKNKNEMSRGSFEKL